MDGREERVLCEGRTLGEGRVVGVIGCVCWKGGGRGRMR